jgi:iron complex outermembrane receptor protein
MFAQTSFWVVKDNAGSPLPGVNIVEKGTQNGVATDMDGSYKIKVKDGATLIFSYVGYARLKEQPQKEL